MTLFSLSIGQLKAHRVGADFHFNMDNYSKNLKSSQPTLPPTELNPPLESCVLTTQQSVWLAVIVFINRQSKIFKHYLQQFWLK